MRLFQAFLALLFTCLAIYTLLAGNQYGWDIFQIFFGDIASISWPGQFNLDFLNYLSLSAIWLVWRHRFSGQGFLIGLLGLVGGFLFLAPYILIASIQAKGNVRELLLGKSRLNE